MRRSIKHMLPAMEAIAFQSGAFFKELKMLLEPHCETGKEPSKSDLALLATALDKVIYKTIGVKSAIEFKHQGSCMFPPDISANNAILGLFKRHATAKEGMELISLAGTDKILGKVDLKNSKLSGFLSETPVRIIMDIDQFTVDKMTAGEYVAVLLHELGHYFTYCETLTRTVQTNQVLAGMERVMRNGDTQQYEIALKKAGEVLDLDKSIIEDLKNSTDTKVVLIILATESAGTYRTQNSSSDYDVVTWEMASDQFAARHGAGRDMVTALDKVYGRYGSTVRQTKIAHYWSQISQVSSLILLATGGVLATAMGAILPGLSLIILSLFLFRANADYGFNLTYDTATQRAVRVRQQLVEAIKDPNTPKELALGLVKDVQVIDKIISEYGEYESWLSIINGNLFSSVRNRQISVKFQKQLEALAANSLFVKAFELKNA